MSPDRGSRAAGRLILRGGGATAVGFAVRFGARFGFLFVAARLYGAALFGAYVVGLALVEVAVIAGGLGSRWMLFQWLDERDGETSAGHVILDTALIVLVASGATAGVIAVVIALLPEPVLSADTALAILLLAPTIPGQALCELLFAATRWTHVIRYEVIGKSIVLPYTSVVAAVLAHQAGWTEAGLPLSYGIATLITLGYALFGLGSCYPHLSLAGYRVRLARLVARARSASANAGSELVDALYVRFDLYLVAILLGESAAGIYGMAKQVVVPLRQIRQSLDGLLVPVVSNTLTARGPAETGRAIASASRLILAVQVPVLIGLFAIGAELLGWLGRSFAAGYWALLLLAAVEALQSAFGVGDLLFFYRRPSTGLMITAASGLVGLTLSVLLAARLEITGVALGVLLGTIVRTLARRHLIQTHFGVQTPLRYLAANAGAGMAGFLTVLIASDVLHIGPFATLCMALGAAFSVMLASWLVCRSNFALEGFTISESGLCPTGAGPKSTNL